MRNRTSFLLSLALCSACFAQESAPASSAPASSSSAAPSGVQPTEPVPSELAPAAVTPADGASAQPAPSQSPVQAPVRAPAQTDTPTLQAAETARPGAITLHPAFSLAISGVNLSLELPLGQGMWNYEIPFYLGYNERVYDNPYFFAGSGFTLRRYLLERGNGAYFAPSLDILNVHRFEKGPIAGNNVLILAPNLRMGYRWNWKVFTMDASTGFFYYQTMLTQGRRSNDDWDIFRGLFPMTQFALGMPF